MLLKSTEQFTLFTPVGSHVAQEYCTSHYLLQVVAMLLKSTEKFTLFTPGGSHVAQEYCTSHYLLQVVAMHVAQEYWTVYTVYSRWQPFCLRTQYITLLTPGGSHVALEYCTSHCLLLVAAMLLKSTKSHCLLQVAVMLLKSTTPCRRKLMRTSSMTTESDGSGGLTCWYKICTYFHSLILN